LQAFSGNPAVMDDVVAAIGRLRGFADALIDEKQSTPGDDITTTLVLALERGAVDRRDVRALLTELLSASVDNTTNSIGVAIWLLARHPDAWEAVARGEVAIERVVEECARFEPVVRHTTVVAERDTEIEGVAVAAGTLVTVYVAAAHRDPTAYTDPDRFDVFREPGPPQLEFGIGRHFCLGAALARMEIQEAVRAVTARWEPPTLLDGVREHVATTGELGALPLAVRRRVG
jgi:cytochrome P450